MRACQARRAAPCRPACRTESAEPGGGGVRHVSAVRPARCGPVRPTAQPAAGQPAAEHTSAGSSSMTAARQARRERRRPPRCHTVADQPGQCRPARRMRAARPVCGCPARSRVAAGDRCRRRVYLEAAAAAALRTVSPPGTNRDMPEFAGLARRAPIRPPVHDMGGRDPGTEPRRTAYPRSADRGDLGQPRPSRHAQCDRQPEPRLPAASRNATSRSRRFAAYRTMPADASTTPGATTPTAPTAAPRSQPPAGTPRRRWRPNSSAVPA